MQTRPALKDALDATDAIKADIRARHAADQTPDEIAFGMGFTRRSVVAVVSNGENSMMPLVEWGYGRKKCAELIQEHIGAVPSKSDCLPMMYLPAYNPLEELFTRATGSFCFVSQGQRLAVEYHANWPWGRCELLSAREAVGRGFIIASNSEITA